MVSPHCPEGNQMKEPFGVRVFLMGLFPALMGIIGTGFSLSLVTPTPESWIFLVGGIVTLLLIFGGTALTLWVNANMQKEAEQWCRDHPIQRPISHKSPESLTSEERHG